MSLDSNSLDSNSLDPTSLPAPEPAAPGAVPGAGAELTGTVPPMPPWATVEFSPAPPVSQLDEQETRRDPLWNGWDVLALLLLSIVLLFFAELAVLGVAMLLPAFRHASFQEAVTNIKLDIVAQALSYVALVGFMVALLRKRYRRRFLPAIHWNFPRKRWPVFVVIGIVSAVAIEYLGNFLPIPKSLPIDEWFHERSSIWYLVILGIFFAPPVEELFFRGFLYPVLTRWRALLVVAVVIVTAGIGSLVGAALLNNNGLLRFGIGAVAIAALIGLSWLLSLGSPHLAQALAIVVTALAFSLLHGEQLGHAWAPLLLIFTIGVILTIVRVRTGSVASSMLVHIGYNTTLFTLMFLATDHFRHFERMN